MKWSEFRPLWCRWVEHRPNVRPRTEGTDYVDTRIGDHLPSYSRSFTSEAGGWGWCLSPHPRNTPGNGLVCITGFLLRRRGSVPTDTGLRGLTHNVTRLIEKIKAIGVGQPTNVQLSSYSGNEVRPGQSCLLVPMSERTISVSHPGFEDRVQVLFTPVWLLTSHYFHPLT